MNHDLEPNKQNAIEFYRNPYMVNRPRQLRNLSSVSTETLTRPRLYNCPEITTLTTSGFIKPRIRLDMLTKWIGLNPTSTHSWKRTTVTEYTKMTIWSALPMHRIYCA